MRSFTALCLAVLCLAAEPAAAARRRSVTPGTTCIVGPLDREALVSTLALDDTDVYYVDIFTAAVFRVPRNGGLPTLVAPLGNLNSFITDIAVDDENLYLGTIPLTDGAVLPPGAIYAVPKDGGTLRILADGVNWPINLATDGTHVYWAAYGTFNQASETVAADGRVERVRVDGTERLTLAQGLSAPFDVMLAEDSVYFSETGEAQGNSSRGIRRVLKAGSAVGRIEDTHVAAGLADAGSHIVFYGGTLTPLNIGIFIVPKGGGTVRQLVAEEEVSGGPRVIEGYAYYTVGESSMFRVPVIGGTPQLVLVAELWNPLEFELDECAVYYGRSDGLWKGPR